MSDTDFLPRQHVEDIDGLFELVAEDEIEFDAFKSALDDLESTGYIEVLVDNEDKVLYKARSTLQWHTTICTLSDPIKKKIMLCLIDNPKSFFVLFNTQKGKLRIAGKEMSSWSKSDPTVRRPVSILIVDNDRTLSEQSVNGLFDCFDKHGQEHTVKIFELSSNNKVSLKEILTYIDAYAYNTDYYMPLIVALANAKQIEKVVRILHHIKCRAARGVKLAAGVVWDEADKTYPLFRNKTFPGIQGQGHAQGYLDFYNDDSTIFRAGFVTATDGPLLEEEFEECANAYHYKVTLDPEDEANYIAFHSPECVKKYVKPKSAKELNNVIAQRVIDDNWEEHFKIPLTLSDGTPYYRKTIINSNPKGDDMKSFAKELIKRGANAMVFNQFGVTLFSVGGSEGGKRYSTRKQNFNRVLFSIYKENGLHNAPLFILGRRKVDRGLGFHYAPRPWRGGAGAGAGASMEGLIWTDLILGNKIEDLATAVQKVGRGAGIIRQCPQFPGTFTYWIETETADKVDRHYKKVDITNSLPGANTMLQAMSRANVEVPRTIRNHDVDRNLFRVIRGTNVEHTLLLVELIIVGIFRESFRRPRKCSGAASFYQTSLNEASAVVGLLDAIKAVPGAYGTRSTGAGAGTGSGAGAGQGTVKVYRRYFPCYSNTEDSSSLYCVIPLIDDTYTKEQVAMLDEKYAEFIIPVPDTGSLAHL